MVIKKNISNNDIYLIADKLFESFNDQAQILPIKLNFLIQKNKKILINLIEEIEEAKKNILFSFHVINENGYNNNVLLEEKEKAEQELLELSEIIQEVNIYCISPEDLENLNINLSLAQMDAIMFMVEEEE